MYSKRTKAALFAIAIASSLIFVGGGFVGAAFAAKKGRDNAVTNTITDPNGTDNSSPKSQSTNAGDSSPSTGDASSSSNSNSAKDLKSLSKCQSDAAKDGDLTLSEVHDCYGQVFGQGGQEQGTDQSSSGPANDQSQGGQGQQQQQQLSSLNGKDIGKMREGFPF